jgi:flagellar biosynthesis chaperone FliJ
MIQEFYLLKALNIRKKYIKITTDVVNYEKMIKDLTKTIDETQSRLDEIISKIDEKRMDTSAQAKESFLKVLLDLENETVVTEKYMKNIDVDIEKLRQEENQLYSEIKENYPNLSDKEIKKEVQNYLKKFNLS